MKILVLFSVAVLFLSATMITDSIPVKADTIAPKVEVKKTPKADSAKANKETNATITGIASFYSDYFDGRKTATGETFRQSGMTCAANGIALGTWVKVTNLRNNKSIVVKVNDRMAPSMARKGRVVDLTRKAASDLDFISAGLTKVKVEILGKKKP